MSSATQGALPGVGFAEQCIARARALFKREEIRDPERLDAGGYLWECAFDVRDRRFLCRLARMPAERALCDWRELELAERGRLVAAALGLIGWAKRHIRALDALQRERAA